MKVFIYSNCWSWAAIETFLLKVHRRAAHKCHGNLFKKTAVPIKVLQGSFVSTYYAGNPSSFVIKMWTAWRLIFYTCMKMMRSFFDRFSSRSVCLFSLMRSCEKVQKKRATASSSHRAKKAFCFLLSHFHVHKITFRRFSVCLQTSVGLVGFFVECPCRQWI